MKADRRRLTKHFANESAKIDLQRYLQNRDTFTRPARLPF